MRLFHPWYKWECYKNGFYKTCPPGGLTHDECKRAYAEFLSDEKIFRKALSRVLSEWKYSCEQFLTNENINRIAWLGQASLCIETGIPSIYRGGFNLLTEGERARANRIAREYLEKFTSRIGGLI